MPQGWGIVRFPYGGTMAEHEPVLVQGPWVPGDNPTDDELREYMRPHIQRMIRDENEAE